MRRKKHLDRGGGGGGTELFICFTSRPSSASVAAGSGGAPSSLRASSSSKLLSPGRSAAAGTSADAPAPPLHPSRSRRLRNSGSLKGGQSPMFPAGPTTSGGRRGRAGFEPAEPSSPKVTCIGQVRVKGGKRRAKHASASAAALRSRSRRGGGGGSEASFRRAGDGDRDGLRGKNQGWVYQIPVNICEALKTFGSCGGRSLCSPSRGSERGVVHAGGAHGDKKRRRAPAGGSWLCGAAVARCLLAIQEEEDDEVGKGAAVVPAEEMRASEVGLVMEGWDVEEEEEKGVMVGEVEVEKKDEIFVVGKEEEGRVSVCIPPRNALLLMRCRSDPVRMAALSTRFWGSPAAATVEQVGNDAVADDNDKDNDDEEEEEDEDEAEAVVEKECRDEAHDSAVSVEDVKCRECCAGDDDGADAGEVDQAQAAVGDGPNCGDPVEAEKDGHCRVEGDEVQIVRKDTALDVSFGEGEERENQGSDMVNSEADSNKDEEGVPAPENVQEEVKGRRSISSYSPSTVLKEERKLRRLSSRRRTSTSSRTSSVSDRVGRRHSFSAEMEGRRSSFSSLKDSRRASFSIDRDGRRWSFSIEQEHLVAEPKVLMASRKGKKNSSEPESEKDCAVVVAPNSAEEDQESHNDAKEESTHNGEENETAQGEEMDQKVEKVETKGEGVAGQVQRRKKSGELPDCLLMMMYEPKLSMEVSKETWVCSTDFVHWKSYQGKNNRNSRQQKASASGNEAATEEPQEKENAEDTTVENDTDESKDQSVVNTAPKPPPVVQKATPPKPATTEQKVKIELPLVANAAAYAPFVLKRCKSEPLRSSARLAPDACFWKDRHRPLNATGVGF
ncbi:hypothetical protein PR202_gb23459 [Eleusine coracana subsp. coracana]|uniref:Chloroplast protein HCF243 n=1 Tax=Eleusine coracana subsp. coracana TaxID=191504 RepID=A0AAV5FG77_ELECO|nr:hypothetical protein QOZ80_6BG0478040 [Eleusine coracana subsp. coracana]GJN34764.1 hypothetical protein PR202_gb23459 [Eleusine coracana subsp. coracana]